MKQLRLNRRLIVWTTVSALQILTTKIGLCEPKTWFEPKATLTGSFDQGRFGSSLACSTESPATPGNSYIAVGAPDENNSTGAVYIYSLISEPNTYIQRITSSLPGAGKGFGTSVVFINDINGDGQEELAVGEPNPNGSAGKIWIYWSNQTSLPFSLCNVHVGGLGWGTKLASIKSINSQQGLGKLAVGSPFSNGTDGLDVFYSGNQGPDVCDTQLSGTHTASGPANSGFGTALSEIAGQAILVGAPLFNSLSGRVYRVSSDGLVSTVQTGGNGDMLGLGVAGRGDHTLSALISFGAQSAFIKRTTGPILTDHCSLPLSVPHSESQGVVHMGDAFSGFLGGTGHPDASFASGYIEPQTGGSVALFVATGSGACLQPKIANNCQFDPNQQQGTSVTGGKGCSTSMTGQSKSMLLVGSPGWDNNKGRVDVIIEDSELPEPKSCQIVGLGQTPTPTPTPTPSATPTTNEDDSTSFGTEIIEIMPDAGGLPAAIIKKEQSSGLVSIRLPKVRLKSAKGLVSFIASRWRISLTKARQIARAGYSNFYEITIVTNTRKNKSNFAYMIPHLIDEAFADSNQKRRLITTRNQKSLIRISSGTSISVSWRVGFRFMKDRRLIFTKPSPISRLKL